MMPSKRFIRLTEVQRQLAEAHVAGDVEKYLSLLPERDGLYDDMLNMGTNQEMRDEWSLTCKRLDDYVSYQMKQLPQ